MKKIIKHNIFILLLSIIVGLLALVGVCMLPTANAVDNIRWSADMIVDEFTDELLIDGFVATMSGNFTDCLMLEHAVYDGGEHSALEQALRMYRPESCDGRNNTDDWWPGHSLMDYINGNAQPREVEYARYWHGYLIVLKPLLMCFSVAVLRFLNGTAQLLLLGTILILSSKNQDVATAGATLLSVPFLYFISSYSSFSLSICMYITLISMIIILVWNQKISEQRWYPECFFVLGITAAYFDFLTYPIVTLVFPLALCIHLVNRAVKELAKCVVGYSFQWGLGYALMWASKWVLVDLLTGSATIKDAIMTALTRSGSAEGYGRIGGFLKVVFQNLEPFANWNFMLLLFLMAIAVITMCVKNRTANWKNADAWGKMAVYMLIALIPFAWWFVTQNHSEQHFCYTCRIFAGTVFAMLLGYLECVAMKGEKAR